MSYIPLVDANIDAEFAAATYERIAALRESRECPEELSWSSGWYYNAATFVQMNLAFDMNRPAFQH